MRKPPARRGTKSDCQSVALTRQPQFMRKVYPLAEFYAGSQFSGAGFGNLKYRKIKNSYCSWQPLLHSDFFLLTSRYPKLALRNLGR